MKSAPVVIVVGSVLSTGRLLVLESGPPTLSRLPPIMRPPSVVCNVVCNSGRPRLAGVGVAVVISKAFLRIVSGAVPAGIWTTGVGARAPTAANGTRSGSIVMFEGTFEGGGFEGRDVSGSPVILGTTTLKSVSITIRPSLSTPTAAPLATAPTTAAVASVT